MSFHPLAKILVTLIPGSSTLLQVVSEFEAAAVQKRLENLEDPLARFGPEIDSLCSRLYEEVRGIDECTNLVPWNEVYAPHLKMLNRLEANGLIEGAPALFNRNAFERGIRLLPRFVVHLASYYGDAHLCAEMAEGMDQLETGITGDKIREQLPLPPMVIDAFFSIYEEEGQGMKSKTVGYSYYTPR
jgi:hypothetical protein